MQYLLLLAFVGLAVSADWNYATPEAWVNDNPDCGGRRQSPIDIRTSRVVETGAEFIRLSAPSLGRKEATMSFNGHALGLDVKPFGFSLVTSSYPNTVTPDNFHFHAPAEHTIDGQVYDAEVHLVSKGIDAALGGVRGEFLVVAYLYTIGNTEDPLLASLLAHSAALAAAVADAAGKKSVKIELASPPYDLAASFYEYDGSLTAPPCYQTVHWMVGTTARTATAAQITALKAIEGANTARPVQALNSRVVTKSLFKAGKMAAAGAAAAASTGETVINFRGLFDGYKA